MIIHHLPPPALSPTQPHDPLASRGVHIAVTCQQRRPAIDRTVPPVAVNIRARDAVGPTHSDAVLGAWRGEVGRRVAAGADGEEEKVPIVVLVRDAALDDECACCFVRDNWMDVLGKAAVESEELSVRGQRELLNPGPVAAESEVERFARGVLKDGGVDEVVGRGLWEVERAVVCPGAVEGRGGCEADL